MPLIVSKSHAENYADNRNSYCDGQNSEEWVAEVVKRDGGYSVQNYNWDIKTQRRVYHGFADIPEAYKHSAYP